MDFLRYIFSSTIVTTVVLTTSVSAASRPSSQVLTSIRPIHSLTSKLSQGVLTPKLLINGQQSPHHYAFKPSDIKKIHQADLIIWIGPELESNLGKTIKTINKEQASLKLIDSKQIHWLPNRSVEHQKDPHIWLNPLNMIAASHSITAALKSIEPEYADRFEQNFQQLKAELKALDQQLQKRFAGLTDTPFLVSHHAYQYLEAKYRLKNIGALALHPEQGPSAKHMLHIYTLIEQQTIACLFYEAEFPKRSIETINRRTTIQTVMLDPIGYHASSGESLYAEMMLKLSESIASCLEQKPKTKQ